MDFKTRFQGKMTRISKDGGIDDMVKTSHKPIHRVDKVTIRSLQMDQAPADTQQAPPKITYGNTSPRTSPRNTSSMVPPSPNRMDFDYKQQQPQQQNLQPPSGYGQQSRIGGPTSGLYSTQQSNFTNNGQQNSHGFHQSMQRNMQPPASFHASRQKQQAFGGSEDVRQNVSVYSNAKTSFYSNMQQSAQRQQQSLLGSPATDNGSKLNALSITDNQFGQNQPGGGVGVNQQQHHFKSGGFSNFQRPIPTVGGGAAANQDSFDPNTANMQSSITMRLLQQKNARETSQRSANNGGGAEEMNLYAANPFGGLQIPVAGSSGESDQTYNMGARTEYGVLQNGEMRRRNSRGAGEQNPLDTQGSNFIAVQDLTAAVSHPDDHKNRNKVITQSQVITTNIKGPRQVSTSDQFSGGSQGRTSQQLRASVEENRKRNLANVSSHIMSPTQSKALTEQKGLSRPPSHPGPMKGTHPKPNGLPLPPKPESHVKRTNSYVNNRGTPMTNQQQHPPQTSIGNTSKNFQIKQQNIVFSAQTSQRQSAEPSTQAKSTMGGRPQQMNKLQGNKMQARSNSIGGAIPQRSNGMQQLQGQQQQVPSNQNDDSLFQQFGDSDTFQPHVIDIAEVQVNRSQTTPNQNPTGPKQGAAINTEAIQMQMNMMQQQMLLLQQQSQMMSMNGNVAGLNQLTQQMKQIQQMQFNLQAQIANSAAQKNHHNGNDLDDLAFLNQDLPNLADQIQGIPDIPMGSQNQLQPPQQQLQVRRQNSTANSVSGVSNNSQYRPYKQREFNQMKLQTQNTKLGGLGANIGSENWEKAQQKKQAAREYAENVRLQTQANPPPRKVKAAPVRELTAREKALEFAKNNVPKPRVAPIASTKGGATNQATGGGNSDLKQVEEANESDFYTGMGDTGNGGGLDDQAQAINELDAKHDYYADELEKIKAMLQ